MLLSQEAERAIKETLVSEVVVTEAPPKETYSPQSPQSLEFKSLGVGKCSIEGIGRYQGTDLKIPERSPSGETVISISAEAFSECDFLVSVSIPATVQSIGERAFMGCSSLVKISVDSDNEYFSSSDAILYSKNKSTLICCPQNRIGSNYFLNPNVKTIAPYAFENVKNLSRILYEGTPSEFEQITIGEGNKGFTSLPITCNYTGAK